jgi:2-polyprenyl-3-methyl-5-hydroxy-6-metoxy-1,4-benzoquinol methylase
VISGEYLDRTIKAYGAFLYNSGAKLPYEEAYFNRRNYTKKEQLVRRHVLKVLKWASEASKEDLLNGKGKRAVDVGCAYGYTSQVLTELGYETFAFDVSRSGINEAKKTKNAGFLVCDAQTGLPFKAGTFDLVTCFDVLEHLANPEQALAGMFNVCSGIIVCSTPNKRVEKIIRKITRDYDETHINVKSPPQWESLIKNSLACSKLQVDAFHDFAGNFVGKTFFSSMRVPSYGLTVRIMIKK